MPWQIAKNMKHPAAIGRKASLVNSVREHCIGVGLVPVEMVLLTLVGPNPFPDEW
jgi:hypothetical protein